MDEIETAFGAPPRVRDEPLAETRERYTPCDFLQQAGFVIAICLGLAMVAQMFVAMIVEF